MALAARQIDYAMRLLREKKGELLLKKRDELAYTDEEHRLLNMAEAGRPSWEWLTKYSPTTFCLIRVKDVMKALDDHSYYSAIGLLKDLVLNDETVLEEFSKWKKANEKKLNATLKKVETFSEFEMRAEQELKRAETELHMGKDASVLDTALARLERLFA